jgi:hypothetical protein
MCDSSFSNELEKNTLENTEPTIIDSIYAEMEEDRIHLDNLRLDKRFNKNDYDFITRLPLTAKQLINVLYELYPLEKNNIEPTFVDLTESKE